MTTTTSPGAAFRLLVTGAGANVWPFHRDALDVVGGCVVAVHDVDEAAAARVAAERGVPAARSLGALLEHDADAVAVLAPHPAHAAIVHAALEAGFHVLVEKPLAVTVAEADTLVDAARRAGRVLAVALQQRSRAEVQAARRLVLSGQLGALRRVGLVASWPRRSSYFGTAPWRGTWDGEGGGILINQGQHDLDLVCHLAGLPAVVEARTAAVAHPTETEDTAAALLQWPAGGFGSLYVTTAAVDERQRIELVGTSGRLRLTPGKLEVWRSDVDFADYAAGDGNPYEAPFLEGPLVERGGGGGTHVDVYEDLVTAIRTGRPPLAPAAEAAEAVELANALVLSAALSTEVTLPLDRGTYTSLLEERRSGSSGAGREMQPTRPLEAVATTEEGR